LRSDGDIDPGGEDQVERALLLPKGGKGNMDSSAVISALGGLMSDGATIPSILLVTLVAFAGTLVVWVKL
jgi:hypothetical protein